MEEMVSTLGFGIPDATGATCVAWMTHAVLVSVCISTCMYAPSNPSILFKLSTRRYSRVELRWKNSGVTWGKHGKTWARQVPTTPSGPRLQTLWSM